MGRVLMVAVVFLLNNSKIKYPFDLHLPHQNDRYPFMEQNLVHHRIQMALESISEH